MILRESQTLEIFEKSGNGTFILAYTISCNVSVTSVRISEDGNIIAGGSSTGILQIYKKNLTIDSYYLSQEISDSTAQILFIEGTADFSILVTSGDDSII